MSGMQLRMHAKHRAEQITIAIFLITPRVRLKESTSHDTLLATYQT
jgi:hypothetical protein